MSVGKHVLVGTAFGAILYPLFGINSLFFLMASIFIDIDHYFAFVIKSGFTNFNPKTMFDYHDILLSWKHRNDMFDINVFHTFEFILLIGIYASVSKSIDWLIIYVALMIHLLCDFIFLLKEGIPFRRALSFLEYFIRIKEMKKKGTDVNLVFKEAIQAAQLR